MLISLCVMRISTCAQVAQMRDGPRMRAVRANRGQTTDKLLASVRTTRRAFSQLGCSTINNREKRDETNEKEGHRGDERNQDRGGRHLRSLSLSGCVCA